MGEIPEWLRPYCKQDAYIPTKEDIESLEPQSRDEMLLKYLIDSIASDLSNYYTKSEVDNLIDTIPKFDIKVVQTLPSSNISPTTVYLVPSNSESSDIYKEYIYVNNNWELLGIQKADLSNYYNKTETNNLLNSKVNTNDLSTVAISGSYNDLSNKPTNLTDFNGTLPILQGGTGATTAIDARTNLGVMKAYTLYSNTSGTQSNITLSSSSANYSYIEIYYRNDDNKYAYTKVYSPNGKSISLSISSYWAGQIYVRTAEISINGTSLTWLDERQAWAVIHWNASVEMHGNENLIYITSVVGYSY